MRTDWADRPFCWWRSNRKYLQSGLDIIWSTLCTREFSHITQVAIESYLLEEALWSWTVGGSGRPGSRFLSGYYICQWKQWFSAKYYLKDYTLHLTGKSPMEYTLPQQIIDLELGQQRFNVGGNTPKKYLKRILKHFGCTCLLCKCWFSEVESVQYDRETEDGAVIFCREFGDLRWWVNQAYREKERIGLCRTCKDISRSIYRKMLKKGTPCDLFQTEILLYATKLKNNKFFEKIAA